MKAQGGKAVYGAAVGILMLDTRFPRIPGDVGNALTWSFPVRYKVVRNASPGRVVRDGAQGLLGDFIDAARELVAEGVDGITTTCGFLSLFQEELANAVNVPVASSSLMQVELVNRLLPANKRAGILTVSASALTAEHLAKALVPEDTPIGSPEGGSEFTRVMLNDELELDIEAARRDNVQAALNLLHSSPDVGAFVLECTNMVPYAHDIRAATGLPVFTIETFVSWFHSGLVPRSY